jgi:hypothetical protein
MGAETAIAWYLRSKRPKQKLARWLRGGAIGLAALAGLIPMLAQMSTLKAIEPVWASIVLGVAAALVVLDPIYHFHFISRWGGISGAFCGVPGSRSTPSKRARNPGKF